MKMATLNMFKLLTKTTFDILSMRNLFILEWSHFIFNFADIFHCTWHSDRDKYNNKYTA